MTGTESLATVSPRGPGQTTRINPLPGGLAAATSTRSAERARRTANVRNAPRAERHWISACAAVPGGAGRSIAHTPTAVPAAKVGCGMNTGSR